MDIRKGLLKKPTEYGRQSFLGLSERPSISMFSIICKSIWAWLEIFRGLVILRKRHLAVSFFGSARESLDPKYYTHAENLASSLAKAGVSIITGGAGGIMRSGNRGAFRVGGDSVGINIVLPNEQKHNNFLTESLNLKYFFTRKTILAYASEAYVFFPGGFGTLDEFFEMLTYVQTGKTDPLPIVLIGKEFWAPVIKFIDLLATKHKTIDPEDRSLFVIVDSAEEAEHYLLDIVRITDCPDSKRIF